VIRASEFPAVTARWVADTVGMERRPAHQWYEGLYKWGKLEVGKLSPRMVVWWIAKQLVSISDCGSLSSLISVLV
jgi:hypothetical protein